MIDKRTITFAITCLIVANLWAWSRLNAASDNLATATVQLQQAVELCEDIRDLRRNMNSERLVAPDDFDTVRSIADVVRAAGLPVQNTSGLSEVTEKEDADSGIRVVSVDVPIDATVTIEQFSELLNLADEAQTKLMVRAVALLPVNQEDSENNERWEAQFQLYQVRRAGN
ncbi:MAG: hypothetical protein AAF456_17995 [Planctomycetota bacterium]